MSDRSNLPPRRCETCHHWVRISQVVEGFCQRDLDPFRTRWFDQCCDSWVRANGVRRG